MEISDPRKAVLRGSFQAGRLASLHSRLVLDHRRLLLSGRLVDSILDCGTPLEFDRELNLDFLRIGHGRSTVRGFLRKIHHEETKLTST